MKALNKHILLNSIKIIIAAIVAIALAMWANLKFEVSAGIVAILTIQPTKKETIKTAIARLIAFVISLAISFVCFKMLGYTMIAFFIYLAFYIIICESFHWYGAVTMNAVLISHFLTAGNMNIQSLFNEVGIFCIGVGMGIIANLHLRKNVDYIEEMKNETDEQIQKILVRMSERMLNHDMSDYNSECFYELRTQIRKAKNVAEANYNNQFGYGDIYDLEYIRMRDKQYQVLYEMYHTIRHMDMTPMIAEKISDFLRETSEIYRQVEKAEMLMIRFRILDKELKSAPLPVERKEFENRAYLFGLMRHIEELLQIKIDFFSTHGKEMKSEVIDSATKLIDIKDEEWAKQIENRDNWTVWNRKRYAVKLQVAIRDKEYNVQGKKGVLYNYLEDAEESLETADYIVTGLLGEMWPISAENLDNYEVLAEEIGVEPKVFYTKSWDKKYYGIQIPVGKAFQVQTQGYGVLNGNANHDNIPHGNGDYIVCTSFEKGNYRIVNGSIFNEMYEQVE